MLAKQEELLQLELLNIFIESNIIQESLMIRNYLKNFLIITLILFIFTNIFLQIMILILIFVFKFLLKILLIIEKDLNYILDSLYPF